MSDQREMMFPDLAGVGELAGQACIPVPGVDTVVRDRVYEPSTVWRVHRWTPDGADIVIDYADKREACDRGRAWFEVLLRHPLRRGAYAIVSPDGLVTSDHQGRLKNHDPIMPWRVEVPA